MSSHYSNIMLKVIYTIKSLRYIKRCKINITLMNEEVMFILHLLMHLKLLIV